MKMMEFKKEGQKTKIIVFVLYFKDDLLPIVIIL